MRVIRVIHSPEYFDETMLNGISCAVKLLSIGQVKIINSTELAKFLGINEMKYSLLLGTTDNSRTFKPDVILLVVPSDVLDPIQLKKHVVCKIKDFIIADQARLLTKVMEMNNEMRKLINGEAVDEIA